MVTGEEGHFINIFVFKIFISRVKIKTDLFIQFYRILKKHN